MMEIMSNYGAAGKKGFSLDKFAKLIGLPGKVGIDGSMVAEVYAAGGLADIETYCATDVVQTACVFLRHAVMRGRLGVTQHNEAIDMIVERLAADSRYEKFLAGIDINRLRIDEASAAVG
jgi:predicted PolB exonuclease-like 3'-5' exonuclease